MAGSSDVNRSGDAAWKQQSSEALQRTVVQGKKDRGFAGARLDIEAKQIIIFRKKGAVPYPYSSASFPEGLNIALRSVPLSQDDMVALSGKVRNATPSLAARGIHVMSVGDGTEGILEISTKEAAPSVESILKKEFAPDDPGSIRVVTDRSGSA